MKNLINLAVVLLITGCANKQEHAYVCTAGEITYYAHHETAFIMTDDKAIIGDCVKLQDQ